MAEQQHYSCSHKLDTLRTQKKVAVVAAEVVVAEGAVVGVAVAGVAVAERVVATAAVLSAAHPAEIPIAPTSVHGAVGPAHMGISRHLYRVSPLAAQSPIDPGFTVRMDITMAHL